MLFMVYPQMIPGKGQPVNSAAEANSRAPGQVAREGVSSVGNVSTANAAVKAERYDPRIFGFKVNEEAKLARWRTAMRDA